MSAMYGRLVGPLVDRFDADPAELAPDTTFADLDMDSLHLLELFLVVHAELGVAVGEHAATPRATIGAVAEMLTRKADPVRGGAWARGRAPVRAAVSVRPRDSVRPPDFERRPAPAQPSTPAQPSAPVRASAQEQAPAPARTPRPAPAPAPPSAADRTSPTPTPPAASTPAS